MKIRFSFVFAGIHCEPGQPMFRAAEVVQGDNAQRYQRYLCGSLGSVAQRQIHCDRLLKDIEAIENGTETEIKTGGNDVVLTLRPAGVQVDILICDEWCDQPDGSFELRELEIVLEGWRRFLGMPESLDSVVEVTL